MYSIFLPTIIKRGRFFQGVVTKINLYMVIFRSEIKKILQGGEVSQLLAQRVELMNKIYIACIAS